MTAWFCVALGDESDFGKNITSAFVKKHIRIALGIILFAAFVLLVAWAYFFAIPQMASPVGRGPVGGSWFTRWQPAFEGVDYLRAELRIPRPMRIHAVRVDLSNPSIELLVTPPLSRHSRELPSRRTSSFLEEFGCQVAVNASLFTPVVRLENEPVRPTGLAAALGSVYSKPVSNLHALVISTNKVISIAKPYPESPPYQGVGGLLAILENGEISDERREPEPATVVGYSADQQYLYLMVIDGRQRGYSEGVSPHEAASLMVKLGASDAINMDGGGSSTLVMENKLGKASVINRPCNPIINGIERPVATHIGIYALPLE